MRRQMLDRSWAEAGAGPGQILGRPGTDAGESLLTLARSWGGFGEIVSGGGGSAQRLGRSWADAGQLTCRFWADAGQMPMRSWAALGGRCVGRCWPDPRQKLGPILGRFWRDAGESLGRSRGDLLRCWATALNQSALPVPCQDRFFGTLENCDFLLCLLRFPAKVRRHSFSNLIIPMCF